MNLKEVFQKYAAVVFFDTETSGLDAGKCQIIELAAIRVEQTDSSGTLRVTEQMDSFVKLPEGQQIPEKIVELTGITDEMLWREGISEEEAAAGFTAMISNDKGPVLLVAHNAQFDLLFVRELMWRRPAYFPADDGVNMNISHVREKMLAAADYLDSLTVYKDRRAYPHKLANAIQDYNLQGKVQNSHRAIDDVAALFEVVKAMDNERADLLTYVNIFGYNPKYGVSGPMIDKVKYWPQQFHNYMQQPAYTLPGRVKHRPW